MAKTGMRVMLIDANNLLMRASFAADRVSLSADGVPTAALMIFINLLSRHIREEAPTHVAMCWDGGRSAFRTQMYPAYKAQRHDRTEGGDSGLFAQAKQFVSLAGIPYVECADWEADDLIAAYWQDVRRDHPQAEVVILSGDKDMLQLVDAKTTQVRPVSKPPTDRWDVARTELYFGVPVEHLAKAMALIGDPIDNVPGVHGLGLKKAARILLESRYDLDVAMAQRGEQDQQWAAISFALIDLRGQDYGSRGLFLTPPLPFRPTTAEGPLTDFLVRYRLEQIRSRLIARTLWQEPVEFR